MYLRINNKLLTESKQAMWLTDLQRSFMKDLFLITTGFPFPAISMETYLETETQYYEEFNSVTVLSMGVRRKTVSQKREIKGNNVRVYPIIFASKLFYIFNGIVVFSDFNFYKELLGLIRSGRFTFRRLIRLIIYVSRSHSDCRKIIKALNVKKNSKIKNAVSYRFEYQPYVMCLLKKYFENPMMVSRAHRYDLYEERNNDSYIPLREYLLESLDRVYLISDDGKDYLAKKYPQYKGKLYVSRLGTLDRGMPKRDDTKNVFRIVSCSNAVPVKRVDLIIDALSMISDLSIEWIHFGGGELLDEVKKQASDKLKNNISFCFKGKQDNKVVLDYYASEDIDMFINLSESEGIPVSIMEAMSFGIPCIATDVGGTREIVKDSNGYLLSDGYKIEEVANIIKHFAAMPKNQVEEYRKNARDFWNEYYNADKNYKRFVSELMER